MKTLRSFSPPADGVQAFAIDPSLFQVYATWKKRTRAEVLHREIVPGQNGKALLVWFRKTKRRAASG